MPILSIITITYNAEKYLPATLNSIFKQSDRSFEYIIIDGASADSTLEIVKRVKENVDVFISEPDKGLYDAMNKGLELATGEYLWFMNAGDVIADLETVEKVVEILNVDKPDILYSDTLIIDESGKELGLRSEILPHKVPDVLNWEKYNMGMLICHQSFITRKEIAPPYILDNLSADIDWEIKCLKNAKTIVRYPGILSKYLTGGISSQKKRKSLLDRYRVLRYHFGFFPNLGNHFKILLRSVLH